MSSFCEEHVYSDCANFCNWTKKMSAFALTGLKSNGMLSTASSRSPVVRGWRSRPVCARAPGILFASTGALIWMKRSSRQVRTVNWPVELFITLRFHSVLNLNKKNSALVRRSLKKDGNLLKDITIGKSAEGAQVTVPHVLGSGTTALYFRHACEPTSFLHQKVIHERLWRID